MLRACLLGVLALVVGCAPIMHRPAAVPGADIIQPAAVEPETPLPVRSENAEIAAAITDAIDQSPTFARLVDAINRTNGIVYIQAGRCPVPGLRGCLLHLIYSTDHARYLWIRVQPMVHRIDLASTLAHELQHALEVLQQPSIRQHHDLLQFYRSPDARAFGSSAQGTFASYETAAAIAIGATVRMELAATAAAALAAEERNEGGAR